MKKIKFAISAIALITFSNTFGQFNAQGVSGSGVLTYYKSGTNEKPVVVGSEYLIEDFKPARVNSGTQPFQIRFNAHTNVMEFKKDNEELILIKKDNTLIEFTDGKTYELITYNDRKGEGTEAYLAAIKKTENVSIYKLEKINFVEARAASNTYDTATLAQYKRSSDTFYIKIGDVVSELPTKQKEYIKLFPGKEAQIKEYFKSNKINFKDDADLIKFATFLNSIA